MDPEEPQEGGNASGLMQCLRFLAEEAASLNLHQTFSAIQQALRLAASESVPDAAEDPTLLH